MTSSVFRMHLLIKFAVLLCSSVSNGQRIGLLVKPIHYDLLLLPIISGGSPRLCGHVFIDLKPTTSTNLVTFHATDINILDVSVKQVFDTEKKNTSDRYLQLEDLCFSGLFEQVSEAQTVIQDDPKRQQISIVLKQTLIKDQRYRVGLFYVAKVRDDSRGFFRANYKNDNTSCCHEGWFGGTQMEATNARRVLPCLDEPGFKTTFDITIGHNKVMSALSNMPEIATLPMKNTREWMWTRFGTSPPMPTYLLAMFVTDYDKVERIYKVCDRTIRMRFWGRPDQLPHLKQSIAVVADMLQYMETYVRQPFSLPKIDFISAPTELDFEAMENWGLVLFRENRFCFNEETGSEEERFRVIQTMAHELAHQFFGNLVTSDWWSDIWFNEGFCGVFENDLILHALPNQTFYAELTKFSAIRTAMKVEEHLNASSVIRAVETTDEAEKMFDPITYSKGSGLLLMLRNFVGHQNFRNAVITYMERFQFQSVNSERFMEILNEEIHKNREFGRGMDVMKIMHSWTSQQSYPIVRCIRTGNGRIRLSQTPHPVRTNNILPDENTNQLWWIPISMTDSNQPNFSQQGTYPRVWLTPDRPSLEIPYFSSGHDMMDGENNHWILINGEMSSYVRVLYDDYNWRMISRQLIVNHTVIPQITRAQLIDDAFTLALHEFLDYHVVLELIEYLTSVSDEFVRTTTQFHLKWMKERARQNESLFVLFEDYTKRLIFERTDNEQPDENNNLVRSGGFRPYDREDCPNWDDGVCVDQMLGLFHAEMDGTITAAEKKTMNENLERNWCVVMRHGGKDEWKWAWRMTSNDMWASQRAKILSAMTCSQDRSRLKQLLSRVFHPTIEQSPHDTFTMIEKMADNSIARPMVLNFIQINWNRLGLHFRRSRDNLKLLTSASKFLSTTEELDKMSKFLNDLEEKDTKLDRFITAGILDGIRANIRWTEKHSEKVYSVLESRRAETRAKVSSTLAAYNSSQEILSSNSSLV